MSGERSKISQTLLRFNIEYRETNKGRLQWSNISLKPSRPVSINTLQYEPIDAE
jgi:hypothetical protein